MGINLAALFLSDVILVKMCGLLYGSAGYSVVPIAILMSMESMRFLFTWARMYMMLFLFCLWYLYIHAKLLMRDWKKIDLIQMIVCIFFGTLTHYYFYIYAGSLSILVMLYLLFRRKKFQEKRFQRKWPVLFRYIYCGIVGIAASWIFYPWVLWHIFANEQNKHTDINPWFLDKGKEYLLFLKDKLLNDRCWACVFLLILWCLGVIVSKRAKSEEDKERSSFRKIAIGSRLLYSMVVYTLDGDTIYYSMALYMAFVVWASMVLLDLIGSIKLPWEKEIVRIGMAVICVGILYSGLTMKFYVENAKNVMNRMYSGKPLEDDFCRISKSYRNYNCIYIEEKQDNLFQNYWFEFGEYCLFKKMPLEEFMDHEIRQEDLDGCEQQGGGIVVYAPKKCEFNEQDYRWLAGDSSYNIYEYTGER